MLDCLVRDLGVYLITTTYIQDSCVPCCHSQKARDYTGSGENHYVCFRIDCIHWNIIICELTTCIKINFLKVNMIVCFLFLITFQFTSMILLIVQYWNINIVLKFFSHNWNVMHIKRFQVEKHLTYLINKYRMSSIFEYSSP